MYRFKRLRAASGNAFSSMPERPRAHWLGGLWRECPLSRRSSAVDSNGMPGRCAPHFANFRHEDPGCRRMPPPPASSRGQPQKLRIQPACRELSVNRWQTGRPGQATALSFISSRRTRRPIPVLSSTRKHQADPVAGRGRSWRIPSGTAKAGLSVSWAAVNILLRLLYPLKS